MRCQIDYFYFRTAFGIHGVLENAETNMGVEIAFAAAEAQPGGMERPLDY